MIVVVNGEPVQVPEPCTVTDLLEQLGFGGKRIAVECNEEIVPRSQHPATRLCENDRLEVVQAIGGG